MPLSNIAELLLEHGRRLHQARPTPVPFTDLPEANTLVNDLQGYPHAFVLACIMDRQIDAKRAWEIPHRLRLRLGTFDSEKLAALSRARVQRAMAKPTPLHRFPAKMAECLHSALQRISTQYDGDASRIWQDRPSSAAVVRRFLAFEGVGPKIATMATNILAREFRVPMSDYYSIDISVDVHVRRVFTRLQLVQPRASPEELIYTARAIEPTFPGLLDLPAWEIGKTWCRPAKPRCGECYMRSVCPSSRVG